MFKKIFTAIVSLALFSVCLSAQTSGGIFASKQSINNFDGTYTINIDSFVTGERIFSSELMCDPVDVVLVLDVSGSMDDPWANRKTRLDGLKEAAKEFILTMKHLQDDYNETKEDPTKRIQHRVSIVTFAGGAYSSSNKIGYANNQMRNSLADGKLELTQGDETTTVGKLNEIIDDLVAQGATNAHYGLNQAYTELNANSRQEARKLVVFFTDGVPNYNSSKFEYDAANEAIENAYNIKSKIKDKNGEPAQVYVVSIIEPKDQNPAKAVEKYMKYLGSDYPEARGKKGQKSNGDVGTNGYSNKSLNTYGKDTDTRWTDPQFFMVIPNEEKLKNAFVEIATDFVSGGASYDLTDVAITADVVMADFKIAKKAGTINKNDIDTYVRPFEGTVNGVRTWGDRKEDKTLEVKVEDDNEGNHVVTVTGFDFAAHWCGYERINGVRKLHEGGQKLCIDIQIIPNLDRTGGRVETNGEDSGIYLNDASGTGTGLSGMYGKRIATFGSSPKVYAPCDIIIRREGLKKGESAFYTITRYKEDGTQDTSFKITVPVTADADGKAEAVVKGDVTYLKTPGDATSEEKYKYEVVEDTSNWDWSYELDNTKIKQVIYDDAAEKPIPFEFTVSRKSGLSATTYDETNVNNMFKTFEAEKE